MADFEEASEDVPVGARTEASGSVNLLDQAATDEAVLDDLPVDDKGELLARYRLPASLLLIGIALTLLGVAMGWETDDPTLHRLLDGPTNGWIPLLSSILAMAVYPRFRRGSWPSIVTVVLVSLGALARALSTQTLVNFNRSLGWWVALAGALTLIAAAGIAAVVRLAARREQKLRRPSWWKEAVGLVVLPVAIIAIYAGSQILRVEEQVSWPASPGAITADDAQSATEAFASELRVPMDTTLEYAWSTADTVEVWPEGVEFYPRIFADVEAAESSVHVIMFGWTDSDIGNEMTDIVERKLAEGVEVRIIVDSIGSGPYEDSNAMYQRLADAGAEIVVNDTKPIDEEASAALGVPSSDASGEEIGRAEHRKLYVIDGEVVWTGGAGIEDHFYNGEFHDVMARVTGDVVRQTQAVFLTAFASHRGELPDDLTPYFPEPSNEGSLPVAVVQTVPGGFASATQQAREMIDNATEQLDIMNPYLTDEDMADRIVAAAERGVDVRVIVSEESNNAAAQRATTHFYPRLLEAGVDVLEYPGAVVHAKLIVADDLSHFGTLNLDAWSLYRDFEIALVVDDPATADMFRERIFDPDAGLSSLASEPSAADQVVNWVFYKLTWFL
ncbi:MAG: phospholipase D-like domain-containing protein [Acidimicrobiales bacterium]